MPRSSLFLTQWLGAQTGEEVSPRNDFSRFKHHIEHEMTLPMETCSPPCTSRPPSTSTGSNAPPTPTHS